MKIIDSRSGQEMKVGDTVRYGGGEWLRLEAVEAGLLSAGAIITSCHQDGERRLVTRVQSVPLVVRWMHPGFMFQHVGFIPS
jgi:hypothetical protein